MSDISQMLHEFKITILPSKTNPLPLLKMDHNYWFRIKFKWINDKSEVEEL